MNKKKFVVLALLMVAVMVLSSCLFVACDDGNTDDTSTTTIKATEGLLISNGDFKVVDTKATTYPRTLSNWTGSKMYSSSSFRDDVIAGAISLEKSNYDANKSKWDDDDSTLYNLLVEGGRYGDDDEIKNALLVYMPVEGTDKDGKKIHGATAYGYTSTSFTLDKGGYYKLSVDVLTYNIAGASEQDRGARIYLSSNTYAEFSGIDTKGEWETFVFYIEGSRASNVSLSVMLGLGKYSASFTTGLTTGYAVFDNLTLEKLEDNDETAENEALAEYQTAVANELQDCSHLQTTTLLVPNGRFDFGTTTVSSSGTPSNWSLVTGNRGKDDPAPTSLGYNAVIDTALFADNYSKYSSTYTTKSGENATAEEYIPANALSAIVASLQEYTGRVGTNVFMLSQQLMTAQGIKSSRTITVEKNKVYALSVDIYTFGVHGAGVSLILTGSDGKDIVIKGISSNQSPNVFIGSTMIDPSDNGYTKGTETGVSTEGWTTYTFYIQGNQFKDYNYNMSIWLGTDGTNDNTSVKYRSYTSNSEQTTYTADGTFANGWVFIDELNLAEIDSIPSLGSIFVADDSLTLDCAVQGNSFTGVAVDLTTVNLFGEGDSYILNNTTDNASLEGTTVVGAGVPNGWVSNFDPSKNTNPVIDGTISEGVVNIESEGAFNGLGAYPELPYSIVDKTAYMIYASQDSYYEVETAPITINASTYYRISLWVKTVDVSSSSGAYVYLLNKDDDDAVLSSVTKVNTDDYDSYANDWCAITFVIRGKDKEATNVAFKFTLGTGSRWDAATLTSGALYVANMNMSTVSYATYSDTTTGTYVKSVNLASTKSYTFSNGGFDEYDRDDKNLAEGTPLAEQTAAAMPSSWTFNDNTLNPNTNDSTLVAGVIALNTEDGVVVTSSTQASTIFPAVDFNNFYPAFNLSQDLNVYPGEKGQLLAIGSTDATGYAAGFASSSVSLSANSYYQISVYAKTVGLTKASIFLTGDSSSSTGSNSFLVTEANSDWTKYTFVIKVGQTSVSLKLNLWLGEDVQYADVEGADKDEKAENAKSVGAIFFDNVLYKTIDEEAYNSAVTDDTTRVISFLTDSFDAISSTIESRTSLTSPQGWSGAVGTSQLSANTKSGVIYADSNFFTTEIVDNTEYVRILGKDYKVENTEITDEELAEAKESGNYEGMSDEDIISALKEDKVLNNKKDNWLPTQELYAHSGDRMLVINNMEKSVYTYTSSSKTLHEEKYYSITLWMRTYNLSDGESEGAYIELYLGSANETDKPFVFEAQNTNGEWTQYTFLVQTREADVTGVTLKLALGKYISTTVDGEKVVTGTTSGYAMFDDVTFDEITEDEYENAVESDTLLKRLVSTENEGGKDDGEDNKPSNNFNVEMLSWIIPTAVICIILIAVVVVLLVRKIRKPISKKKKVVKKSSQDATKSLDAKRDKYDDNKE